MKEKLREAAELLQLYLDYPYCELCENNRKDGCFLCNKKEFWTLSNETAEMLVNKIEKILIPKAYWEKYKEDDEYYCSNCEWSAPRDAYEKFRDQLVCGARMINKNQ